MPPRQAKRNQKEENGKLVLKSYILKAKEPSEIEESEREQISQPSDNANPSGTSYSGSTLGKRTPKIKANRQSPPKRARREENNVEIPITRFYNEICDMISKKDSANHDWNYQFHLVKMMYEHSLKMHANFSKLQEQNETLQSMAEKLRETFTEPEEEEWFSLGVAK